VWHEFYGLQFWLTTLFPQCILVLVKGGIDFQARFGFRRPHEVHDHLITRQRPALPLDTHKRKQPVLNFVPLAGARRIVTDADA